MLAIGRALMDHPRLLMLNEPVEELAPVSPLNDLDIQTEAPIEVAIRTNEEGSRFVPVMMGSGVFCKAFTLEHALSAADFDGQTVREELQNIGYAGRQAPGEHPVGAYFDAYIEQGPVLEGRDKVIGAVEAVLGLRWYDCVVTGLESHAGSTPMKRRADAPQGAGRIIHDIVAIADRYPPQGRGTVSFMRVFMNSPMPWRPRATRSTKVCSAFPCSPDSPWPIFRRRA